MRLLFDNQIFHAQRFGGISRYFCELIIGLLSTSGVKVSYNVGYTNNIHFKEANLIEGLGKNLPDRDFAGKKVVVKLSSTLKNIQQSYDIKKGQYDVFVPTYYNPYFLKQIGNRPFVLTVYDMIHELFPQYFLNEDSAEVPNKKLLIQKAKKVIAISESTKRDILKIYPEIDESKIEVVYLSHSIDQKQQIKQLSLPEKYVLFVGKRGGYKNFNFFLESLMPLLKADKTLNLICTGPAFTDDERSTFKKNGILNQLVHIHAADDDLRTLYSKALLFVFPSEYEGFGIPILEAMASGCPVVASNASSFPEVAGDAAIYFELNDSAGLTKAIRQVVTDEAVRNDLRLRGLKQAEKFSWDRTVAECLEVFKRAAV
jgi:glycosyltransferase involved in cell wall biosynthesis